MNNDSYPCLVLAPHLEYPVRNGGDILIDRRWAAFSFKVPFVDIVGKDTIVRYKNGSAVLIERFQNSNRSRLASSVRTILMRSHYLAEKFLTRQYVEQAIAAVNKQAYGTVIFSFLVTASLAKHFPIAADPLFCIETQNDEVKWFEDIRKSSRNVLVKIVASISKQWVVSFFRKEYRKFIFLHVTAADYDGYRVLCPTHEYIIAPVGCEASEVLAHEHTLANDFITLLFVGSLGVRMNVDALKYFSLKFLPGLTADAGQRIAVRVVGSSPSHEVEALCKMYGWNLIADATDEQLIEEYNRADFSILPFQYSTGGKLKLLNSLAAGVPFLATTAISGQVLELDSSCLMSDDPGEWLAHIRRIKGEGLTDLDRRRLIERAKIYSWRNLSEELFHTLLSKSYSRSTNRLQEF